jgi:hypothetical protein
MADPALRLVRLRDAQIHRSTVHAGLMAIGGFVAVRSLVMGWLCLVADHAHRSGWDVLTKWDAQWYAGIAAHGYGVVRAGAEGRILSDEAFFPVYPWTERLVSGCTGLSYVDAGLVVSALAGVVAAAGIFAVGNVVVGRRAAVFATVLWAALPVGVVQSMAYSESLFTALAAWAVFAVLREGWVVAGALACAAGATRPQGIAVVAAVVVTASAAPRRRRGRRWAVLVAPLGLLGYLGWVGWRHAAPSGYLQVSEGWGNHLDGGRAFVRWTGALLAAGQVPLTGILVVVGLGLLVTAVTWSFVQRQPLPLLLLSIILVALALTTSGYFGSKPRYLIPAFPLLFPPAQWLASRRPPVGGAVVAACSTAAAIYGAVWLLGSGPP